MFIRSDNSCELQDAIEKVSYAARLISVFSTDARNPIRDIGVLALTANTEESLQNISAWSMCVVWASEKPNQCKWFPIKSNLWDGQISDYLRFTTKPKSFTSFSSFSVCLLHSYFEGAWISQPPKY